MELSRNGHQNIIPSMEDCVVAWAFVILLSHADTSAMWLSPGKTIDAKTRWDVNKRIATAVIGCSYTVDPWRRVVTGPKSTCKICRQAKLRRVKSAIVVLGCGCWCGVLQSIACALVPPNPKDDTPACNAVRVLRLPSVVNITLHPSTSRWGFMFLRCTFGGPSPFSTSKMDLIKPTQPADISKWPTLVLAAKIPTVSIGGVGLRTDISAPNSIGSPKAVPVPWHSAILTS